MDNQALARLEALRRHNADRGWVNCDLYRLLYRPELYEVAYERIKSFGRHGRNLRFEWQLRDGQRKAVPFAENTDWTVKTDAFVTYPPNPDLLGWHTHLRTRSKLGFPCLICGTADNVAMHHVRHIRKTGAKKPKGFQAVMRAPNRKQLPVGKGCHEEIHKGEYDGIRLQDLAYDFTARPT